MEREFAPLPPEPIPAQPEPAVARVLDYWRSKCGADGELPLAKDINLMDLYEIAPNLLLADVERAPDALPRYRWRFWGTALTNFFSVELSGRYIDEAYTPAAARQIIAAYDWILQKRAPHFWTRRGGLAQDNQEHLVYRRLICPLTAADGEISRLFGIITFDSAPPRNESQSAGRASRQFDIS